MLGGVTGFDGMAAGISWVFPKQRGGGTQEKFSRFFHFFLRLIWEDKDGIGELPFSFHKAH